MSAQYKWYLTTKEAVCILGVSTTTVRKCCRSGELTAYTDNFLRILISSRQLINMIKQSNKDYDTYTSAMSRQGWHRVVKEEHRIIDHGTTCAVKIFGNEWERWWNPNEDDEPPDEVGAFYSRVVHIVHVGSDAENAAMDCQSTADSLR